jgi:hypothetical protein
MRSSGGNEVCALGRDFALKFCKTIAVKSQIDQPVQRVWMRLRKFRLRERA